MELKRELEYIENHFLNISNEVLMDRLSECGLTFIVNPEKKVYKVQTFYAHNEEYTTEIKSEPYQFEAA